MFVYVLVSGIARIKKILSLEIIIIIIIKTHGSESRPSKVEHAPLPWVIYTND